jgi:menaquinone-dependent protoporphyrinogen oxidase
MSTAIIYTSSHGTTEKIANMIKKEIQQDSVDIIKLKLKNLSDLKNYDQIIIGTSIHAGKISRVMQKFINANHDMLSNKKIGLYLCCMYEGETAKNQLYNAFPPELCEKAIATEILGGEFLFEKMNFFERAIVKKISGTKESISKLKINNIKKFANAFN